MPVDADESAAVRGPRRWTWALCIAALMAVLAVGLRGPTVPGLKTQTGPLETVSAAAAVDAAPLPAAPTRSASVHDGVVTAGSLHLRATPSGQSVLVWTGPSSALLASARGRPLHVLAVGALPRRRWAPQGCRAPPGPGAAAVDLAITA